MFDKNSVAVMDADFSEAITRVGMLGVSQPSCLASAPFSTPNAK
jgi:hypothetical protein